MRIPLDTIDDIVYILCMTHSKENQMTLKPFDRSAFGLAGLQEYRIAECLVAAETGTGNARSAARKFLATVPQAAIEAARAKYVA